jgi:hypothetical protein
MPLSFLSDNLNLADVGNIDPFAAGDLLCQRFQVPLDRFADNGFSQTVPLPGDVCNSLCVVHLLLSILVTNVTT